MPHTMIAQHITHIRARIPILTDIRDRKIHLAPAGGMTGDVRPPINLAATARALRDIARDYERIGTQLRNIDTTLSLFSDPDPDPVPHARTLLTHKHHLDQQLANREATQ